MATPTVLRIDVLVLGVAFISRLTPVLRSAGLRGTFGYDSSVYFAAADALLHGRMPYRDYTLVHPPGVALVLTPFALVGQLTSDHAGFVCATLAWMLLGAINAVLVVRVAREMGVGARAAVCAGMFYAVWPSTVNAEYHIRLEPLGNFALLCGLLAAFTAERTARWSAELLSGAGLGAAVCVKIWWIVPLAVVLLWHLARIRRTRLLRVVSGAVGAIVLCYGPFFAMAPKQMWSMVVVDQLGRPRIHPIVQRLLDMTGVHALTTTLSTGATVAVLVSAGLLVVLMCWRACRFSAGRLAVALLAAQFTTLLLGPPWFGFYTDFLGPALALCVAAATHREWARPRTRAWAVGSTVLIATAGLVGATGVLTTSSTSVAFPSQALAPSVAHSRCVMSDSPMSLIELNVLSRDLGNGCQNLVDVIGTRYSIERHSPRTTRGRTERATWHRDLERYLLSGDRLIIFRTHASELGAQYRTVVRRGRVLSQSDGVAVVRGSAGSSPVRVDIDAMGLGPASSTK